MISIVIPVRNGVSTIGETIASVLAQGRDVHEVIVVDDGSTDGTSEVVAAFDDGRIRLVSRPSARAPGVSGARNAGLDAATGEWLVFLDADDRLAPASLAGLVAAARADNAVAAYGDYRRIDEAGRPIGRRHLLAARSKPSGDILERLLAGNFIVNGGVMAIRTAVFRELGGFDESLRYCEDWHAWCRLASRGPITYAKGLHVLDYRVHQASTMMRRTLTMDDYRPALDAVFADPPLMGRIGPKQRSKLHAAAEAHLSGYLLAQAVRARDYSAAARGLLDTLVHHPLRSPRALLLSGAALVGL